MRRRQDDAPRLEAPDKGSPGSMLERLDGSMVWRTERRGRGPPRPVLGHQVWKSRTVSHIKCNLLLFFGASAANICGRRVDTLNTYLELNPRR